MKSSKNPYHSVPQTPSRPLHLDHPLDYPLSEEETGALGSLRSGLEQELDGFVKLELTAEQMLADEVRLVRNYIKEDSDHFWLDLKDEFVYWELTTGQLLLSAADPSRVDWQLHHWWGDEESQFH